MRLSVAFLFLKNAHAALVLIALKRRIGSKNLMKCCKSNNRMLSKTSNRERRRNLRWTKYPHHTVPYCYPIFIVPAPRFISVLAQVIQNFVPPLRHGKSRGGVTCDLPVLFPRHIHDSMPDVAATASTSGKSDTQPSGHLHRRYFIGPQPEKAVTQAIKDESHGGLLKSHAIRALLTFESHHGSSSSLDLNTPADEPSRLRKKVIDDVWKQSTWGTYFVERKNAKHLPASTSKWVGESFRIGTIGQTGQTGYDFIEETEEELRDRMSLQSTRGSSVAKSFMSKLASAPTLAPIQTIQEHSHSEPIISLSQPVPPSTVGDEAATPTSITHLIDHGEGPSIPSDPLRPSIIKTALVKSDTNIQKAKRKAHFSESQKSIVATPPIPLPPSEVLERVGADVQQTSAGASLTPQPSLRVPHLDFGGEDNVILRGMSRPLISSFAIRDIPSR